MQEHELALEACDEAVNQRQSSIPGTFVHPARIAEALVVRGKASLKDNNVDDAVSDFKQAVEKFSPGQAQQDCHNLLQEAEHKKREWDDEHNDQRQKIALDLPPNLEELDQQNQCKWLKKQYRKMSLKWHPDKVIILLISA
jgi:hypothetical protein